MIYWPIVMDNLYTKNYAGMLAIEPHSNFWHGKKRLWGIDYTDNYFKSYIMPKNYECNDNPFMP